MDLFQFEPNKMNLIGSNQIKLKQYHGIVWDNYQKSLGLELKNILTHDRSFYGPRRPKI
jgi:hypothetical protein